MDSITSINHIRDNLRTYLVDPYVLAGGKTRSGDMWIFSDEIISSGKFPQVQLLKMDNPTEILDIGPNYAEYEQLFINVWFRTKNGFKVTIGSTTYTNAQLIEYYQGLIKRTLKSHFNVLFDLGVKGYRHLNTTNPAYDPDTQLYYGAVTIKVFYFNWIPSSTNKSLSSDSQIASA